jgi:hypothetical protein
MTRRHGFSRRWRGSEYVVRIVVLATNQNTKIDAGMKAAMALSMAVNTIRQRPLICG